MAGLEVAGMQELLDRLEEMGTSAKRIGDKALLAAANPILEDAVANAPVKKGKGRAGLSISRPKSKGDTKYVLIGINEADISKIFYMKFHEYGTSKMPAKPFLAPAFHRNKQEAFEIIKEELMRGMGL